MDSDAARRRFWISISRCWSAASWSASAKLRGARYCSTACEFRHDLARKRQYYADNRERILAQGTARRLGMTVEQAEKAGYKP